MKLVLKSKINNNFISISFKAFDPYEKIFEKSDINQLIKPITASLIIFDEEIKSYELAKLKEIFKKLNLKDFHIYSNFREIVLSGKSLKINSTLIKKQPDLDYDSFLKHSKHSEDTIHKGTIRSGNRISSNGDLYVIGDVNPGAIVTAKYNIYVWGKLLGIASAGKDGNNNSFIASLYLHPLQLRISEIVAVGPKEKPRYQYPEIAILENKSIIIKPYIMGLQE